MLRRNFLKSVIGLVSVSPFLALPDSAEWQRIVDPRFRMLYQTEYGYIQAPGVQSVVFDPVKLAYIFTSEVFNATETLIVNGGLLLDSNGRLLSKFDFDHRINLCSGDTLKLTNAVYCNIDVSLFELIDEMRRKYANR